MQNLSDNEIINIISDAIRNNTETDKVEFKDTRGGFPTDLWRSITGFSNKHSGGGVIVFGVVEDRVTRRFGPTNLTNVHELLERASAYMNDRIVNSDRADYRLIEIDGCNLIAMVINTVQEEKKPCFDSRLGMDRGACIRDGSTDRLITDDELRHFIRNSSAFKFDINPADAFEVEELDNQKISAMLREMGERTGRSSIGSEVTPVILANTKIAVETEGKLRPTLAGAMIFSSVSPQSRSPYNRYTIRCIRYAGSTPASDIIDSQDIEGTLDVQIDSMQAFVLRNISRSARIEGTLRIEEYSFPEDAIREVLANAVIHRDYTITESYTQVRVFSDRIEVVNPGNLPPGVTVNNIKEMQFSRNAVMASLMRDLRYLEEYGRGIDLVFSSMQRMGLPRPIFRNAANMFSVTLLGGQFSNLTERQLEVWQLILNKSRVTAKNVAEQMAVSRPTAVSDLTKLMEVQLVRSIGSGPSTTYEIGANL